MSPIVTDFHKNENPKERKKNLKTASNESCF